MLPDAPLHSGWHETDDEQPVTVRQREAAPEQEASPQLSGPATDISPIPTYEEPKHVYNAPRPRNMHLSALAGIAIVLLGGAFYFGIANLRGSLTDGTTTETAVTITTDGQFSPTNITVHPGDSITIENLNTDPQVLKSKDGRDLFPVQVLFTTPFVFTVPSDASGMYTYVSETLPDDRELTITIDIAPTTGAGATSVEENAPSSVPYGEEIPIPFGSGPLIPASSMSSSASEPSAIPVVINQDEDTATISLQEGASSSSSGFTQNTLPSNPYTVGTQTTTQGIAVAAEQGEQLHSGAPLQQLKTHTPRKVSETGPAGMALLVLPALFAVAMVYRRMCGEC
jgi:plastocyanin